MEHPQHLDDFPLLRNMGQLLDHTIYNPSRQNLSKRRFRVAAFTVVSCSAMFASSVGQYICKTGRVNRPLGATRKDCLLPRTMSSNKAKQNYISSALDESPLFELK